MFAALSDERIYEFIPEEPPASLDALRKRYEFLAVGRSPDGSEYWLNWMLLLRADSSAIGYLQATVKEPESCLFAYVLNPGHWRCGYAKEASTAIISYLFSSYLIPAVTAHIDTRNIPSQWLVESLGFERVKTILNADEFKGSNSDEYVYELQRNTWLKRSELRTTPL